MCSAVTNDGCEVVSRRISSDCRFPVGNLNVEDFQLDKTAQWIISRNFNQIGLQFPDELLGLAFRICKNIVSLTTKNCFILGDSSYAGCCVDELAGQRFRIDALVHYGRACLSPVVGRIPVLYVFGQIPRSALPHSKSMRDIAAELCSLLAPNPASTKSALIITYDFPYQDFAYSLYQSLLSQPQVAQDGSFWPVVWSEPHVIPPCESASCSPLGDQLPPAVFHRCARSFHILHGPNEIPNPSWSLVYVGRNCNTEGNPLPFHRILTELPEASRAQSCLLDPFSLSFEKSTDVLQKTLRRRSYLIEKAKDARCFGILIGTLSVKNYNAIVKRLQTLLKRAGRSYITLVVGRLNPAKLANISELDVLVIVACPETSLLDSRDFLIPVITPFELECALHSEFVDATETERMTRLWNGKNLCLDYQKLLPGGDLYLPENVVLPRADQPREKLADVSLITGKLHELQNIGGDDHPHCELSLATQKEWTLVDKNTWDLFSSKAHRTWYGLDPQLGHTPVAQLQEGQDGVPTHYSRNRNESETS
ncbi:unnamed protein product [Calicophoron daubneyi]|uniref:2-(3-amino-3-carboxypropyl)histidine synthase subunit 2 n=1 Tax=Calicophoron daubneyi TaxID=300641 RepID=A0AAV2T2G7_CALDB